MPERWTLTKKSFTDNLYWFGYMIVCGILNIKIGSLAGLVVFDFRMGRVRYLKKGSGTGTGRVVRQFSSWWPPSVDQLASWLAYKEQYLTLSHLAKFIFAVPVARSKSERLFSAAGNTVTLRNFEKVQPEGSQVDGTKEEDHCTCSMSLILMNEINWICPFTSCITHPILYSIAVKMKY